MINDSYHVLPGYYLSVADFVSFKVILYASLHGCQADLLTACEAFCSGDAAAVRQRAILALAVAFLQHFVRANWTGPPEQAGSYPAGFEGLDGVANAAGSDEFFRSFHCES